MSAGPAGASLVVAAWRSQPLACLGPLLLGAALAATTATAGPVGAAAAVVGLGVGLAVTVAAARSRVEANAAGLRVRQPIGSLAVAWSQVAAVHIAPLPQRRLAVALSRRRCRAVVHLEGGPKLVPFALRRVRCAEGDRAGGGLDHLWRQFGEEGAPHMWGGDDPPGPFRSDDRPRPA